MASLDNIIDHPLPQQPHDDYWTALLHADFEPYDESISDAPEPADDNIVNFERGMETWAADSLFILSREPTSGSSNSTFEPSSYMNPSTSICYGMVRFFSATPCFLQQENS
jgi:hypothetical protein